MLISYAITYLPLLLQQLVQGLEPRHDPASSSESFPSASLAQQMPPEQCQSHEGKHELETRDHTEADSTAARS